jgi:hypothetical protein
MGSLLKEDLKRAFFSYPYLIALTLVLGSLIYGLYPDWDAPNAGFVYHFRTAYASGFTSILALLAPLLVTIPFVSSYAVDRESGFLKYLLLRTDRSRYAFSKLIANALAGGSVLFLALTLLFFGLYFWFPGSSVDYVNPGGAFHSVYFESEVAYVWVLIGLSFLFGATYATLGLAASAWVKNKFFGMVFPFFVYLVPGFLFPALSLDRFEPSTTYDPSSNIYTTPLAIFVQIFLLMGIGVISFYVGMMRKEEADV